MSATLDLRALLQRHYIKPGIDLPGGVFLPEVGWNGCAGGGCDAIYVGFTSASGRLLVGHELKVSRSDWLSELNKPGKADRWADQCHEWWLVVSDPAIVHDGELPAGWGLLVPGPSKTRMRALVKATRKPEGHTPSWDAVRSVMARWDTLRAQAIADAKEQARQAATAEVEDRVQLRMKVELAQAESDGRVLGATRERLQALQKALGHNIVWDDQRPGFINHTTLGEIEQIRAVLDEVTSAKAAARRLTSQTGWPVRNQLDALENAITGMRAALAKLEGDPAHV
ncbi:hypothetical protein EV580_1344 [Mycobacterium sp. BK086]|uniref:hypothetical protein n=1 Tax=Mycobacterium sp. BK086 TaxID=2512165 RepID=UPI0010EFC5EA|nr:hypothetical protein [Mycobacterium sp. BK086]TDO18161.1 hypothetical protein EV580_1344 [Mycobacterium sp. BK086]